MQANRFFLILFLLLMSGRNAFADMSAAQLLSQQFAEMESMRANFAQRIHDEKGNLLQEAYGRVSVKRPRQFYWHTEQPYEHVVVADGKTLWVYDKDLEQISRQPFTEELDRAPALILSGEAASLVDQYAVTVEEISEGAQRFLQFTLIPHRSDNVFRQLVLRFQQGEGAGRITAMSMRDSFEQVTDITFSNVEYNPAIDATLFQFTPPAGIDVIDNEP